MKQPENSPATRLAELLVNLRESGVVYNDNDFAEKVGLCSNFLSNMKTGKKSVSKKTAERIANTFPVNPEWLLTGVGEMLRPQDPAGGEPSPREPPENPLAAMLITSQAQLGKALDLNESTHAQLRSALAALAESQRQIATLIDTIAKLSER